MISVQISPELRKYLAERGIDLDRVDEQPEPDTEVYEPTAEDEADYAAWREECRLREQDEEDARRHCEWIEMMEREHGRD